jgi:hypothetical protein
MKPLWYEYVGKKVDFTGQVITDKATTIATSESECADTCTNDVTCLAFSTMSAVAATAPFTCGFYTINSRVKEFDT